MGTSNSVPLYATPVSELDSSNMVVRKPAIVEEDLDQQLPSSKRSIYGIDFSYGNSRIAGAVEDDDLLGSNHLKSVVDNVFISGELFPFSSSRNVMMGNLNNNTVSDCCIGISVYYTCEGRRKVLRDAIAAGWRPCNLLHKTTAAALMYRFSFADLLQDNTPLNTVFIYMGERWGMEMSIVELKKDQLKVLSHAQNQTVHGYTSDRAQIVLRNALNESGIRADDVHSVQVVGNKSQTPQVMKVFRDFFGKEPMETIIKSSPVATGCFIQCAMLCGAYKTPKFQIVDILPYSVQLNDATVEQVLFPRGYPIPSIKSVTFHRRSTFFLDLVCNPHDPFCSSEMISYMIGPFDCNTEEDVSVKVQLDLHGIPFIELAILVNGTIVPVVEYTRAGPHVKQQKLLIDSSKHLNEFLTIQAARRIVTDKIIADDRIEKEELRKSKVALAIQLTESNARLQTTTKQHEKSQSAHLDKVQKAEKKLVDISAQFEGSLNAETKKRIELEELTMQLKNSLDVETNRRIEVEKNLGKEIRKCEKLQHKSKQYEDLQAALRDEVQKSQKDLVDISARLNTQDKIIAAERSEKGKLHESKVTLEIQLTESNARLETTTKKHEELQTALRDKVQKAEKKLVDISAELMSSLNDETKRRLEIEKILEDEKSKSMKLQIERKKVIKERDDALEKVDELSQMNFTFFNLPELKQATNNFDSSHKIGEGGYGSVYKGTFRNKLVAIKILKKGGSQGEAEFNQEVTILSNVRHPNLVALLGASLDARALVYEFLPNGSLDSFLTGTKNFQLSWQDRIRIAFEICSVLIFLHSLPPHGIAHGDLKPENVLLDSNFRSKLSDFGTCRKLQLTGSTNTPIHPTERPSFSGAYADPEYLSSYILTPRSDTFAFGIILLQLITGTKPQGIRDGVEEKLKDNKLDTMVDGAAGGWPIEDAKKLAQLGIHCSDQSRRKRPDLVKDVLPVIKAMKDVAVSTLKESISDNALS